MRLRIARTRDVRPVATGNSDRAETLGVCRASGSGHDRARGPGMPRRFVGRLRCPPVPIASRGVGVSEPGSRAFAGGSHVLVQPGVLCLPARGRGSCENRFLARVQTEPGTSRRRLGRGGSGALVGHVQQSRAVMSFRVPHPKWLFFSIETYVEGIIFASGVAADEVQV